METWILMVALLFQSTLRPQAGVAATQAEFANHEACEFALQKVKNEWGKELGVGGVYAICVPSGFKRGDQAVQ